MAAVGAVLPVRRHGDVSRRRRGGLLADRGCRGRYGRVRGGVCDRSRRGIFPELSRWVREDAPRRGTWRGTGRLPRAQESPPPDVMPGEGHCAPEGIRTPDLLLRRQTLYPLSYRREAEVG